jgi:hypothetical protein
MRVPTAAGIVGLVAVQAGCQHARSPLSGATLRASRSVVVALAMALIATGCDRAPAMSGVRKGERAPRFESVGRPYWLGASYRGLPLTATTLRSYIYGDCEAGDDSGCAPPYEVQHSTTCERNPLSLDVLPRRVFRVRGGGIAATQPEDGVDLSTGRYTVTVFANSDALAVQAVHALRRRSESRPARRLAAPVYPPAVMQELKRVVVARERLRTVEAISRRTGLSRAAVRVRLRIAGLLGTRALRGVSPPTRPWRVVARERKAALFAEADGIAEAARRFGVSRAELRAMIRHVRGLAGRC